mgnify:CR=1 FL=1
MAIFKRFQILSRGLVNRMKKSSFLIFATFLVMSTFLFAESLTSSSEPDTTNTQQPNSQIYKTSFDCSKASNFVETSICTDEALAEKDLILNSLYIKKLKIAEDKYSFKREEKQWVLEDLNSCGDKDCIFKKFEERINYLQLGVQQQTQGSVDSNKTIDSKTFTENTSATTSNNNDSSKSWFTYIAIIFGIIIFLLFRSFKNRCHFCGKWSALTVIKKERLNQYDSHIVKEVREKNKKGETIRTKEVVVPATKYEYKIYERCKYCQEVSTYITTETVEN